MLLRRGKRNGYGDWKAYVYDSMLMPLAFVLVLFVLTVLAILFCLAQR